MEVESLASCPLIIERTSAQSLISLPTGPIWSRDDAKATSPYLETAP